ncbi:NU6M oxidoreductase, partial [Alaudala cheleensis]|nr:NU6M oxidoreductase [Alaudala cheleensis]
MRNFVIFWGAGFILGELAVASNPSYYGVVGLVLAIVAASGWLMSPGASFFAAGAVLSLAEYQWVLFPLSLAVDPF